MQCEMLLTYTIADVTNRSGSCQVYSDDDKSNDHLCEEGRYLATAPHEWYGGFSWIIGGPTGYPLPPQYPTFRVQE